MNNKGNNKSCLANLIWTYKHQAKNRGYAFELTKGQFKELTKQNCWYCGQEPAQLVRAGKKKALKVLITSIMGSTGWIIQ